MSTNQWPPMDPAMSITVFCRIARYTNRAKNNYRRLGVSTPSEYRDDTRTRDQWMRAARIIKGDSVASKRRYMALINSTANAAKALQF